MSLKEHFFRPGATEIVPENLSGEVGSSASGSIASDGFVSTPAPLKTLSNRNQRIAKIAFEVAGLADRLPDSVIARRFLNNAVRLTRILHNQPVFGRKK
jgi:hypothetical protein